jgi:ferritin-like metal-binding protein YciE
MENKENITVLHNLLDYDFCRYLSAEMQLKNSIPAWIEHTSSLELRLIMSKYLNVVQQHLNKIRKFFDDEKMIPVSLANGLMAKYIEETNEKLINTALPERDACMLASLQHINRCKMSKYGVAATFANALALEAAAILFLELENNEKGIECRLFQLARPDISSFAVLSHLFA